MESMELFPPEIEIIRKRVRRFTLRVSTRDERIVCTVPWFASKADTIEFITRNRTWIEKQRAKIRALKSSHKQRLPGTIHFLGDLYTVLNVPNAQFAGIINHEDKVILSSLQSEDIEQRKKWYKDQALQFIPPLVQEYALKHNFTFGKIAIKHQQSKWGSCTVDGNLNFNAKMMLIPMHVIQYLIIHELSHTKHFHHGASFWELVEECYPEYLKAEEYLRTEGKILEI